MSQIRNQKHTKTRLGKQKNFCVICQKQLNNANDYANHVLEQAHINRSKLYLASVSKNVAQSSAIFKNDFLNLIYARCSQEPVLANTIYNQLISSRNSEKLAATRWKSINGLLLTLKSEGHIEIIESAQGPYVQLVRKAKDSNTHSEDIHQAIHDNMSRSLLCRQEKVQTQLVIDPEKHGTVSHQKVIVPLNELKLVKSGKKITSRINLKQKS